MSATSITPKDRNSIYERILKDFLKGGKDYILYKEFALGKGWEESLKHFQYLYLNLLCNFSCDVEYYFNQKLKGLNSIEIDTKIDLSEVFSDGDIYSLNIQKTNNVTVIESLIGGVKCETPSNINVIIKAYYSEVSANVSELASEINSLNPPLVIAVGEIYRFITTAGEIFELKDRGAGTYGIGGITDLTLSDFILIEKELISLYDKEIDLTQTYSNSINQ